CQHTYGTPPWTF
nr:immunoglobulin light chain junction region [Macaca mulatta]MOW09654.1 immunoglobulin light chain junction region [Macaca mulatta]MOW09780.1 immunoglobulin light chain junction region [Macaca mulatta]MOW10938.1 immunoglobulin light chain junction region [Macaca mulatta]MOW11193.1 immunoglobulin light chain junction region [Macaca mulatta]